MKHIEMTTVTWEAFRVFVLIEIDFYFVHQIYSALQC